VLDVVGDGVDAVVGDVVELLQATTVSANIALTIAIRIDRPSEGGHTRRLPRISPTDDNKSFSLSCLTPNVGVNHAALDCFPTQQCGCSYTWRRRGARIPGDPPSDLQ
jgi:hypothetical protein